MQAQIDPDHLRDDRQGLSFILTQAGYEVAASGIFGYRDRTGLTRQITAPADRQRLLALGKKYLPVAILERGAGKFSRLAVFFAFKDRILGTAVKEIFKSGLLMAQALLKRHRADVAQKRKFRVFLHPRQLRIGFNVADFDLLLIKRICAPTQYRIVNKAHTAKRLGKNMLLLGRRVETVFVGALSHKSQNNLFNVRWQT